MIIRRALRALAVTVTAGALALTTVAPSSAAMSEEMAARAAATMKDMAGHVATWQAANPGRTFTVAELHSAFPQAPKAAGVVWVGLATVAEGYCFMAVDSMKDGAADAAPEDSRFLDSTTGNIFVPGAALVLDPAANPACSSVAKVAIDSTLTPEQKAAALAAPVTNPTPFHASLVPPAPAPTEPVPPAVDAATVRAGMVKDVKLAARLIKRAQKKKATARPTLKQLRKAGLKPSKGTKVTVKYVKRKPRLHCVRAVNPDAGLKRRHAVWFDSGLKKVVTGAKPKGKRSACAKLM